MHDLAVVITCLDEADWVERSVTSLLPQLVDLDAEIVVAEILSRDGDDATGRDPLARVRELGDRIRVVRCTNGGFAHANNEAARTCDARYLLFLNPDTEFVAGSLGGLVRQLDRRTEIGLAGVRQLTPAGEVYPTMRRQANALRMLGEALGSERIAPRAGWLCHRQLDLGAYDEEHACDWTVGSFMLVRREALMSAGLMDERFFFTAEEQELCLRIRRAGWSVVHIPSVTIVHYVDKRGFSGLLERQRAYAKRQYAQLNLGRLHRAAYLGALGLFYLRRLALAREPSRRRAHLDAIRVLAGLDPPPFAEPPATALPPHSATGQETELDSEDTAAVVS